MRQHKESVKLLINKKVLLRERKRHTSRRIASTPSVVLAGPGGTLSQDRGDPQKGHGTSGSIMG